MKSDEFKFYYNRNMKAHNIKSFDSDYMKERYQKYIKKNKAKTMYFNRYEFLKIMKIKNIDINLSIDFFNKYLDKYENDFSARAYYVSALIKVQKLAEAKIELDKLEDMINSSYDTLSDYEIYDKITSCFAYSKLKLLIYSNRYKEAYNYLLDNLFIFDSDMNYLETVILFNKKKLGYLNTKYYKNEKNYLVSQVIDYSENRLLDHIDRHFNAIDNSDYLFNSDFPIEDIIRAVKKSYPNEKAIYGGLIEDTYIYKYDNCGKIGKTSTDFFKVYTLHDSNEIINITPCPEGKYLDYVDLNYLNPINSNIPVNTGIDRFNKKYTKCLIKR